MVKSTRMEARRRAPDERGNVLIIVPAALLILLLLASLAVDAAALYLGQRRIADLTASIANDVVASIDLDVYYGSGMVEFDRARVAVRRSQQQASASDGGLEVVACDLHLEAPYVTVTCEGIVRPVLLVAWPGRSSFSVAAVETVRAARS
ncbi:MAG: hypothetical protein WD358_08610 [Nitriliruptoraceae bacterium]